MTVEPTETQLATAHPFEPQFTRHAAWTLENLFNGLAVLAGDDAAAFVNDVADAGQQLMDAGQNGMAKAWAVFVVRKTMAELTAA